ncbi:MAG: hypothetical protein II059_00460, partial [Clostridia bacterium]|nr:hypothetical protein [Clostridia bacterium]
MKKKTVRFSKRICTMALSMLLLTGVVFFCGDIFEDSITAEAATIDIDKSDSVPIISLELNHPLRNLEITSANSFTYDGSKKKVTVKV